MKILGKLSIKLFTLITVVFICFIFSTSCEYLEVEDHEYSETEYLNISGAKTVSPNSTQSYYTFYLDNADYVWTVPAGATIKSGQGTSQISVLFGDTGGKITVSAKGMSAEIVVTTN